ncbi:hypothetical protein QK289_15540 [Exiguobacterium antarcticum]|uniref:Response regulator receiver protein n=1 Tax=Exiguobacterium antarcticum TaxID=132920 RepID=A0ABT6R6F9_9BACL|nr:hypothetical protein [Exiguobacterium antarcticum]MDI3236428.1 hypothetical protein [Exiguobacterium antarcticum]
MKLVAIIKSDIMFDLLKKRIGLEKRLPDSKIRRVLTISELEEAIEFYKSDIFILDPKIPEGAGLEQILKVHQVPYLLVEDDVKDIHPVLIEKFGVLIEEETEEEEVINHERIVYREKLIEKEIITKQYQSLPSKVIIVGSLTKGAGSTIIATNLARMIGERKVNVAYMEHPLIRPYMFDYLQIHNNQEHEYFDVARAVRKKGVSLKEEPFVRDGVEWHVIDAREPANKDFEYHQLLMATHAIGANIMILDISDRWEDPGVQEYMRHADLILLAAESDLIKYEYSLMEYELFESHSFPTKEFRVMKYLQEKHDSRFEIIHTKKFKGLDMKLMLQMFQKRPVATLPYIDYPTIMAAVQNSKILYDYDNSSKESFEKNFLGIISRFLPKDLLELKTARRSMFSIKRK